jgi:hypothetical protein
MEGRAKQRAWRETRNIPPHERVLADAIAEELHHDDLTDLTDAFNRSQDDHWDKWWDDYYARQSESRRLSLSEAKSVREQWENELPPELSEPGVLSRLFLHAWGKSGRSRRSLPRFGALFAFRAIKRVLKRYDKLVTDVAVVQSA